MQMVRTAALPTIAGMGDFTTAFAPLSISVPAW
jgi:hypothetical protein